MAGPELQIYVAPVLAEEPLDLNSLRRYLLADVYARFRRGRGDAVSFPINLEQREGDDGERQRQALGRLERLGVSCDSPPVVVTSAPDYRDEVGRIFAELRSRDLVRRGRPAGSGNGTESAWLVRTDRFAGQCEEGLGQLGSWPERMVDAQRAQLGRVEGVEVEAALLGYGNLTLFTPYAEAVAEAEFVAVPTGHPFAATLSPGEVREGPLADVSAAVPGVEALLPVILTDSGAADASLGIPAVDDGHRALVERFGTSTRPPLGAIRSQGKPRPAVRYRLPDLIASRSDAEDENPSFAPEFLRIWMWAFVGESAGDVHERRLFWPEGDDLELLRQRLSARLLEALEPAAATGGEPFPDASFVGAFAGPDLEVTEGSSDALRLAVLHAAAPATATTLPEHAVRQAEALLAELGEYALHRLERGGGATAEIERSTRLRRRLAAWCDAATAKIEANLECGRAHRATFETIRLFRRIQDFEARCEAAGGLTVEDEDAIGVALARLLRVSEPCIPATAARLGAAAVPA